MKASVLKLILAIIPAVFFLSCIPFEASIYDPDTQRPIAKKKNKDTGKDQDDSSLQAVLTKLPSNPSSETQLQVHVSGGDYYRHKLSVNGFTNCALESDYSIEAATTLPITNDVSSFNDGLITLCVVVGNLNDRWQAFSDATIYEWVKDTIAPVAIISGVPDPKQIDDNPALSISGVSQFRYKMGLANSTDCSQISGYSTSTHSMQGLLTDLEHMLDGDVRLCVIGQDEAGNWQDVQSATEAVWLKEIFNPSHLFTAESPIGAWYDPSDLTTMFQDAQATIPANMPGDPVGLILDKSKGALDALGSELVTDHDFAAGSPDWVKGSEWSIDSNGRMTCTDAPGDNNARQFYQAIPAELGSYYRVNVEVYSITGNVTVRIGNTSTVLGALTQGSNSFILPRIGNISLIFTADLGTSASITSVSVKSVPGTHLYQTTTSARPILARVPEGGRRNLLTATDSIGLSPWTVASFTSIIPNQIAHDSTATAVLLRRTTSGNNWDRLYQTKTIIPDQPYRVSVEVKAATDTSVTIRSGSSDNIIFDLLTGIPGTPGSSFSNPVMEDLGNGWWRCSVTITKNDTSWDVSFAQYNFQNHDAPRDAFYIRNPQFELGDTTTAYQTVSSGFDVTEVDKASLYHLHFDGSNDYLLSAEYSNSILDRNFGTLAASFQPEHIELNRGLVTEQVVNNSQNRVVLYADTRSNVSRYANYAPDGTSRMPEQLHPLGQNMRTVLAFHNSNTLEASLNGTVLANTTITGIAFNTAVNKRIEFGRQWAGPLYFQGRVFQTLLFGHEMTTSNRKKLENYFNRTMKKGNLHSVTH
jgi:hypothetical protein